MDVLTEHHGREVEDGLGDLASVRSQRAQRGRDLLRAYHERGDLEARERLIEQYLPLVRALAARYARGGDQLEDLVQVGCIGLIKAIDRFDLERG
ncbi:MAG: sigma-70 family RNA polymerase sigma factor, partial [Actinomycetota bacterium]|nr:sigma-70 family RNA polymerase sigma factor [Actinomycetota bacterium]